MGGGDGGGGCGGGSGGGDGGGEGGGGWGYVGINGGGAGGAGGGGDGGGVLMQMYSQHLLHEYCVHSAHTPSGYTSQQALRVAGVGSGAGSGRFSYTLYVRETPMGLATGAYATPVGLSAPGAKASKGARPISAGMLYTSPLPSACTYGLPDVSVRPRLRVEVDGTFPDDGLTRPD